MGDLAVWIIDFLQEMGPNEFRIIYSITIIGITILLTTYITFPGSRIVLLVFYAFGTYAFSSIAAENSPFFDNLSTEFLGACLALLILVDDARKENIIILIGIGLGVLFIPDIVLLTARWLENNTQLAFHLDADYIASTRTDLLGAFVVFALSSIRWRVRSDERHSRRVTSKLDQQMQDVRDLRLDNLAVRSQLRAEQRSAAQEKQAIEKDLKALNNQKVELLKLEAKLKETRLQVADIEARLKSDHPDIDWNRDGIVFSESALIEEYYELSKRRRQLFNSKARHKEMHNRLDQYQSKLSPEQIIYDDEDETEPAYIELKDQTAKTVTVTSIRLTLIVEHDYGETLDFQAILERVQIVFEMVETTPLHKSPQQLELLVRPRTTMAGYIPCTYCDSLLAMWDQEAAQLLASGAFLEPDRGLEFNNGKATGFRAASESLQGLLNQHRGDSAAAV